MNILITGSNGYLGGRLVESLSRKYTVRTILSRNSEASNNNSLHNVPTVKFNWADSSEIRNITEGVDVIVHAYGLNAVACEASISNALTFNAVHTANILEAAIENKVKNFIFLSTAHVYGNLVGNISELNQLNPIHPYGFSKKVGEDVINILVSKNSLINCKILRLSNVFGSPVVGNKTSWTLLVNDLCRQAVYSKTMLLKSNGLASRNFLPMTDFLNVINHFIVGSIEGDIFNVGSEKSMTVLEMANLIKQRFRHIFNVDIDISVNRNDKTEANSINYDCSKLMRTNFTFSNNITKEIDDTLKYFLLEKGGIL